MKIRFKIASTIMSMCLALVVMGFAVWAASTQTLPVVNTVDFTSIHVLSTVTGTVTGAKAETFVNYGPVSTLAGDPEGKLGTWAIGSAMEFANETEPIIITLTVVNNSDERSLSFELSGDSFGEFNGTNLGGTNIDRTCVYSINNATPTTNATYTSGAINVEALKTATIVMTLDISDNGKSVTAFDNSFSTTLRNVDGTGGEESFSFNPETKTLTLIEGSTLTEENLPDMYSQDESEPAYYGLFEDQAYTQKVELPYSGATTLYAKFEETPTNLNLYLINDDSEYGVSKNETTTGDVVIPEKYNRKKITEISDFTEIENLTSIYIPKFAVIQDNSDPFYLCPNLANIFVSSSNSEQKDIDGVVYSKDETILVRCPQAKTGSYTIPSTVETLFYDAFALCSELTSITIPTSVTSIGDYAFESCTGLTSLDLSENMIESLGAALFYGCSSLNNIILPNTLIEILDACFFSCSSLISITIPTTVTFIGQEAFSECSSLNQVIINSETIANSFDDETSCGYLCGFVTEVCILDSISTVSAYIITEFSHVTTMSIDLNNYNKYYKQLNNYAFSDGSNELATYSSTSALNWDNLPEMSVDGKPAFYGLYTDMDFTNKVEYPYSGDATTLYARFDTLQTNVSLTLLGESYSAKKGSTPTALVEIPERFNWLPITTLPDFAFYCWSLDVTNIFVPDTVTNVGRESFMGCDNLTNVTMSKNLTTIGLMGLENCKGLKTISLAHIENIGNWAFDGCSDLQSITIPDCTIGENVFFGCNSLTEINVADSLANYSTQDGVLYNKDKTTLIRYPSKKIGATFTIPDGVVTVGQSAFENCEFLTQITISASVSEILCSISNFGNNSLTAYQVAEGNTSFASVDGVLYNNGLSIILEYPASKPEISFVMLETVCDFKIKGCVYLQNLTLSNAIKLIDINLNFGLEASSIKNVIALENNTDYSSENGVLFNKDKTSLIFYPNGRTDTSYTVPATVTSINKLAFTTCSNLESIILSNVSTIGEFAFNYCIALSSITMSSVTNIGSYAFATCSSLASIKIPSSVTTIGDDAFNNCNVLTTVIIDSTTIANGLTSAIVYGGLLSKLATGNELFILDSIGTIGSFVTNTSNFNAPVVVEIESVSYKKFVKA